jgi:hypothetical protein
LPKALQFHAAAGPTGFKLMNYPNQPDARVRVAANTKGGQNLAFSISGEGTLKTGQQSGTQRSPDSEENSAVSAPRVDSNNRLGGGLGPPIDAPDPLQKYRWWILGGSAAALVIGGVWIASRQQSTTRALRRKKDSSSLRTAMQKEGDYRTAEASILELTRARAAAEPASGLMDGIKEELFQIEVERKQGQISQAEYQKTKAALDQTLARALRREAQQA